MKIYCKEKLSKRSKKQFLKEYFRKNQPSTFYVKDNSIQCKGDKNRSIGDIKALLDGTFKTETSFKNTIKILMNLFKEDNVRALLCPDLEKVVFYNPTNPNNYWNFKFCSSGNSSNRGIDGFTWNKLKEIYEE